MDDFEDLERFTSLAEAIADRKMIEAEAQAIIGAQLKGEVYQPESHEIQKKLRVGQIAVLLSKIDNPYLVLPWDNSPDAQLLHLQLDNDESFADSPDSKRAAQSISKVMATKLDESVNKSETEAAVFADELIAAQMVADEAEVSIEDVYRDDELFEEATRRALGINELAEYMARLVQSFNRDMYIAAMMAGAKEHGLESEIHEDLLNDPVVRAYFDAMATEFVENARENIRQYFVYNSILYWGSDALEGIELEHWLDLAPKQPLVPFVASLAVEKHAVIPPNPID